MDAEPVVFLVCDKSKARRHLAARLNQLGHEAETFKSMEEFHARPFPAEGGCVVQFLSDPDGDLDWLRTAGPCDVHWPVVAIAAEADVETAVRAMKNGVFDFLLESCPDRRLSLAVKEAIRQDAVCRRQIAEVQSARRRMEKLAPALRDVLQLLLRGRSNREIAEELKLSERAIEDRRARIMRTMKVRTVVALVRQVLLADRVTAEEVTAGRGCDGAPSGCRDGALTADRADSEAYTAPNSGTGVTRASSRAAPARRVAAGTARKRPKKPGGGRNLMEQYGKHNRQPKRAR
jgi:FixJ family two-component response regulator